MEDIYTIKVRTNPDPRDLYPSERRYSASTVLGLSVVHLSLAITALLLASLNLSTSQSTIISNLTNTQYENFTDFTNISLLTKKTNRYHDDGRTDRNDDIAYLDEDSDEFNEENEIIFEDNGFKVDQFFSLTLTPCFMALGALIAGSTGLLAWKRWYIDQNIRWFCFASSLSVITSLICLISTGMTLAIVSDQQSILSNSLQNENSFIFSFNNNNVYIDRVSQNQNSKAQNVRMVLAVNLIIAAILEFVWSLLSSKIAWKGMRNNYPDDIVLSRGKIQVNVVHKGNKKTKCVAPDILNHHPKKKKFAKYFPKKENNYLPKQESNFEYQERVNKFLSSNFPDM